VDIQKNDQRPIITFFSSVKGSDLVDSFLHELARNYRVEFAHSIDLSLMKSSDLVTSHFKQRWQMYGSFALQSLLKARGKQDISIVTTNPFFNPWLVSNCSLRKGVVINLLWDVYPDCLEIAGVLKHGSIISRLLEIQTRASLRRCTATVFIGDQLKTYIENRYGRAKQSVVIPVGADEKPFENSPPVPLAENQVPRILYSGNMGHMHDIKTLSRALCAHFVGTKADTLEFYFQLRGANHKKFIESIPADKHIKCAPGRLFGAAWVDLMKSAHVGIVTMKPGSERVVMPSKVYSSMVAGQAILAVCPEQSDLADLIRQHNCGWVVAPGDTDKLSCILKMIATDPSELHIKRVNAYNAGHSKYSSREVARQWFALFDQIASPYK